MSDTNKTNETKTWAQLYALRGGWRQPRRDGQEYEQTCRRGHVYESDAPEPRCPTCESVFAGVDVESKMPSYRMQDAIGVAIIIIILSFFTWCLWSGIEEKGRIDETNSVQSE